LTHVRGVKIKALAQQPADQSGLAPADDPRDVGRRCADILGLDESLDYLEAASKRA